MSERSPHTPIQPVPIASPAEIMLALHPNFKKADHADTAPLTKTFEEIPPTQEFASTEQQDIEGSMENSRKSRIPRLAVPAGIVATAAAAVAFGMPALKEMRKVEGAKEPTLQASGIYPKMRDMPKTPANQKTEIEKNAGLSKSDKPAKRSAKSRQDKQVKVRPSTRTIDRSNAVVTPTYAPAPSTTAPVETPATPVNQTPSSPPAPKARRQTPSTPKPVSTPQPEYGTGGSTYIPDASEVGGAAYGDQTATSPNAKKTGGSSAN